MEGLELESEKKKKITASFEKMPVVAVLTTDTVRAKVGSLAGRSRLHFLCRREVMVTGPEFSTETDSKRADRNTCVPDWDLNPWSFN